MIYLNNSSCNPLSLTVDEMESQDRSWKIDILVALFGLSTWLNINGVWAEMPLLVPNVSGSWNLPSYLSLVVQLANIGPAVYILLHYWFPKVITQRGAIFFVLATSILSIAMFVQLFSNPDNFSGIYGRNFQSGAFFGKQIDKISTIIKPYVKILTNYTISGLTFVLAQSVCLSRILHIPFMGNFQPRYLTSFFIGEGLANFIPSVLALAQGINNAEALSKCESVTTSNFSMSAFFLILLGLTILSSGSFVLLNMKSITRKYLREDLNSPTPISTTSIVVKKCIEEKLKDSTWISKCRSFVNQKDLICLLLVQGWAAYFCNGLLPAIQSYACLPYGVVAYHLALNLSHIANPVTSLLIPFLPDPTKKSVAFFTVWSAGVILFIVVTALLSPNPPFAGQMTGTILMVSSFLCSFGWEN